jgi:predicted TIM-barrel fold metal-dependent hydrolase
MRRDASPTGVPVVPRQCVLRFSAGTESPPWVKLPGACLNTDAGAPGYSDEIGRACAEAAPERVVWGSHWPHRGEKQLPDDAVLLDLLLEWAPDERARQRILVDNPQALYRFDPT